MSNKLHDYIYESSPIATNTKSKVYKGYNSITNEQIVIRKIKVNKTCNIDVLKNLDHINIVKIYDIFYEDKYMYIVVKYYKNNLAINMSLEQTRGETHAKKYIKQILKAIKYLYANNIYNIEINPKYLYLDENNVVKLSVFGIIKDQKDTDNSYYVNSGILYCSPETVLSTGITDGADTEDKNKNTDKKIVWSLGILLFRMLYGYHPLIKDEKKYDLFKYLINMKKYETYESIDELIKENESNHEDIKISEECKKLLLATLQKNADKRLSLNSISSHEWINDEISEYEIVAKEDTIKVTETYFSSFMNKIYNFYTK